MTVDYSLYCSYKRICTVGYAAKTSGIAAKSSRFVEKSSRAAAESSRAAANCYKYGLAASVTAC